MNFPPPLSLEVAPPLHTEEANMNDHACALFSPPVAVNEHACALSSPSCHALFLTLVNNAKTISNDDLSSSFSALSPPSIVANEIACTSSYSSIVANELTLSSVINECPLSFPSCCTT
eukprot:13568397-Ditylum_brightwellii.AAC.1